MATVGSLVRLVFRVLNSSGALTNPSTATLTIKLPDGTSVNPSVTLPPSQTGTLVYDYQTTQIGWHTALWLTTGPVTADTTSFSVDPAASPGLFSLSEAKAFLNESATNYTIDDELRLMIFAVTEIVERVVGPVIPKTYTEKVQPGWQIALRHGPIQSIVSITPWMSGVGGETVTLNSSVVWDANTQIIDRAIGFFRGPYKVVYTAGRTVIPYAVIQGAKDMLRHLWDTQRGSSVVGPGPGNVDVDNAFNVGGRVFTVPRAVLEMLQGEAIGPQVA